MDWEKYTGRKAPKVKKEAEAIDGASGGEYRPESAIVFDDGTVVQLHLPTGATFKFTGADLARDPEPIEPELGMLVRFHDTEGAVRFGVISKLTTTTLEIRMEDVVGYYYIGVNRSLWMKTIFHRPWR